MSAMTSNEPSWYLVQTKPRQEFRAAEQLQNQGFTCFLPTLQIEKAVRGGVKRCVEPLFSRYLFIQLDTATCDWSPIRSTRGVSKLVSFGSQFATLPAACIDALQRAQGMVRQSLFMPGDRVMIANGPFSGLEGIYQLSDGDARALVLIELMNQPQKLKFAMDALRKAA